VDTALFLTLFLFAVQTTAGVAPMRWPQHKWISDVIFYMSGFFAVVCLVVYVSTNSDWLLPSIKPFHVIALGLSIAVGGLVWQWKIQTSQPLLEVASKHQTAPNAVPVQVSESPKKITYSERDIRELLDGLADAHDLVEKHIFPATHRITEAAANWQGYIPNRGVAGFAKSLEEMNAALPDEVWKPIDALLEKYGRVKDQLRFALALDHEAARGEISRSLRNAIDALQKLPDSPSEATRELVKPQFSEAYRQGEIAYNWVTVARTRIASMTQNLRTRGVTGYE
jgi:hypothetical protein